MRQVIAENHTSPVAKPVKYCPGELDPVPASTPLLFLNAFSIQNLKLKCSHVATQFVFPGCPAQDLKSDLCYQWQEEARRNSSVDSLVPSRAEWAKKQGPATLETSTPKKQTIRFNFLFAYFPMSVQENLLPVILRSLIWCLPSIPTPHVNTRNNFRKRFELVFAGQEREGIFLEQGIIPGAKDPHRAPWSCRFSQWLC